MSLLRIQLLGNFDVYFDKKLLTAINTARLRSLFAYLVLHGDVPQPRYQLAFLFWPDSTEEQAKTNLRQLLHYLRKALPSADRFLNIDSKNVQWIADSPYSLDVSEFEALSARLKENRLGNSPDRELMEQAVKVYRGELLPSCYDDWILPIRERLAAQFEKIIKQLVEHLENKIDYRSAIPYAQQLLQQTPMEEDAYLRLMRLFALNGDRAKALRTYHNCVTVLRRELGIEPGSAIRKAYENLVAADSTPLVQTLPQEKTVSKYSLTGRQQEGVASVAVLPFVDMSPQKDQEYFCDGLAEELITALSKVQGLLVTSRTSAFQFKGRIEDIRVIGEKLNAEAVLEGSVRKAGNKLRITAKLVNTSDGYHIWSEKYDREMEDIFAIQDDIARNIVKALHVKFSRNITEVIIKRYTDNVEAYNLYLQGRYYWNNRYQIGLEKGLQFFEQAIRKDPDYALAYCGVADSYSILGFYGYLPPGEAFNTAITAAEKALQIDDTLAEAHLSRAIIHYQYEWDWVAARREVERGLELRPDFPLGHQYYGLFLGETQNEFQHAESESKRGLELDPLSPLAHSMLAIVYYFARDYDQAIEESNRALEIDPNFLLALWVLGRSYAKYNRYDQAVITLQQAVIFSRRSTFFLAILGCTYAEAGMHRETIEVLQELNSRSEKEYVAPINFAWIYTGMGKTDEALHWLEKAYEDRNSPLIFIRLNPDFDGLHLDPRFSDLLRRLGLV